MPDSLRTILAAKGRQGAKQTVAPLMARARCEEHSREAGKAARQDKGSPAPPKESEKPVPLIANSLRGDHWRGREAHYITPGKTGFSPGQTLSNSLDTHQDQGG